MAGKAARTGKKRKTALTVILSIVVICLLLIGGVLIYLTTPHMKHFDSVNMVSADKIDGKYLYHANSSGLVSILKADDDLTAVYGSSDGDNYDLGVQDLKVKATGIDIYRTDNSGIFMSFPAIEYEYVSE